MSQYLIKILVTSLLVVLISEAAKKWTLLAALLASLPLISILAMIWLYLDTKNIEKVSALSSGIFWIVIPSLLFFALFPVFTRFGWNFWGSLLVSISLTALCYFPYIALLGRFGIQIK